MRGNFFWSASYRKRKLGCRADASKADDHTTPAQAIEKAGQMGDELNVVPETFRPVLEATTHRTPHQAHLLPSGYLEGRFTQAEELPGGWYRQPNDSGVLRADMTMRAAEAVLYSKGVLRKESVDSVASDLSTMDSGYRPRRVESFMDPQDTQIYFEHQTQQRPAGGARMGAELKENSAVPHAYTARPTTSRRSSDSVSMHFGLPYRQPTLPTDVAPRKSDEESTLHVHRPIRPTSEERAAAASTPTLPKEIYRPIGRYPHSPVRGIGISPLARKSFTRLASPPPDEQPAPMPLDATEVIELERAAAARASLEAERRGRQRERVDRDARGRRKPRKLSKQKPDSKKSSRSRSNDQGA